MLASARCTTHFYTNQRQFPATTRAMLGNVLLEGFSGPFPNVFVFALTFPVQFLFAKDGVLAASFHGFPLPTRPGNPRCFARPPPWNPLRISSPPPLL